MTFSKNQQNHEAIQQQLRDARLQQEQAEIDQNKSTWLATGGVAVVATASLIYVGSFYLPDDLMASVVNSNNTVGAKKLDESRLVKFRKNKQNARNDIGMAVAQRFGMPRVMTGKSCKDLPAANWDAHGKRLAAMQEKAGEFRKSGNPIAAIQMIRGARSPANIANMASMMCDLKKAGK